MLKKLLTLNEILKISFLSEKQTIALVDTIKPFFNTWKTSEVLQILNDNIHLGKDQAKIDLFISLKNEYLKQSLSNDSSNSVVASSTY